MRVRRPVVSRSSCGPGESNIVASGLRGELHPLAALGPGLVVWFDEATADAVKRRCRGDAHAYVIAHDNPREGMWHVRRDEQLGARSSSRRCSYECALGGG